MECLKSQGMEETKERVSSQRSMTFLKAGRKPPGETWPEINPEMEREVTLLSNHGEPQHRRANEGSLLTGSQGMSYTPF